MSGILHIDSQPLGGHSDKYEGSIKGRQNSEKARQNGTHPDEKSSKFTDVRLKAFINLSMIVNLARPTVPIHQDGNKLEDKTRYPKQIMDDSAICPRSDEASYAGACEKQLKSTASALSEPYQYKHSSSLTLF